MMRQRIFSGKDGVRAWGGMAGTVLLAAGLLALQPVVAAADPVHQLRIYEIPTENRQVFHQRFREHAARIMASYGFWIVAIWESRADDGLTEFIYLLQWRDEEAMATAWTGFMADAEWAAIKQRTGARHGTFVTSIEDRTLVPTDYSPRFSLLD